MHAANALRAEDWQQYAGLCASGT